MRIDVLTLFPGVIEPYLSSSIVGRARQANLARIQCVDIRNFTTDKHRSVDDRPFGGGPGMVLMCGPVFRAVEAVECTGHEQLGSAVAPVRLLLSPQGERLDQRLAELLSHEPWLIVICGHYEGFDERIRVGLPVREISIGDYVLSGGEPAAIVLIDAVVRLLHGVTGSAESTVEESFSQRLLEYPQYTRPREYRGMKVPEVLLSGDHARIRAWRRDQSVMRTALRRPDLLADGADGNETDS